MDLLPFLSHLRIRCWWWWLFLNLFPTPLDAIWRGWEGEVGVSIRETEVRNCGRGLQYRGEDGGWEKGNGKLGS